MKEASGEASMTGITIALIAIVAVVATPIIRSVVNTTRYSACCQSLGGVWEGGTCEGIGDINSSNIDTLCPPV